jgi:hypothetical protein
MKCAYCLEEMNEGARVCRVCHRTQPLAPAERQRRIAIATIAAFVALAASVAGYFLYDALVEEAQIENSVLCFSAHGMDKITAGDVRKQLEVLDGVSNDGWRANLKVMNSFGGCEDLNSRF